MIFIIVMNTTYFMDGCISNNEEAVRYFDEVYKPVEHLVDLDNRFNQRMEDLTIPDSQVEKKEDVIVDEDVYKHSLEEVEKAYAELAAFVNTEENKLKAVKIYNNEVELQRAALRLFVAYKEVIGNEYVEILAILKKDEPKDEDNKRFNVLLRQSSDKLDSALEVFYDVAGNYGDQYGIDIEFEEP